MAAGKQANSIKKLPQKPSTGPLPYNAPRRSARVQKSTARTRSPVLSDALMEATRLDHQRSEQSNGRSQEKRVTFEDEQGADVRIAQTRLGHHDGHTATAVPSQQHKELFNPSGLPKASYTRPPRRTSTITQPYSDRSSSQTTSSLSESRAQKVHELLMRDMSAESSNAPKTKRILDDHHHDIHDIDSNPIKRRKGDILNHDAHLQDDPIEDMLFTMRSHPMELSIEQISRMFLTVQTRIFGSHDGRVQGFAQKHFSFALTTSQKAAWPLHELRTKYIPLFMTTRYIADGSQYGWREFFTDPDTRQHLVSAVLGEWFTQRIFKHTAFGFPQNLIDILEDKDREYLHYDAVVRSKERARLMKGWFGNITVWPHICEATDRAVQALAEELMTVLHPLLPPLLFDPLEDPTLPSKPATTNGTRRGSTTIAAQKTALRDTIKLDLEELIHTVTALHYGIRITGANGTIVRLCPTPPRNTPFHPTAPNVCINPESCNANHPTPEADATLLVKMTCFPRVEAIVPSGPDMLDLQFYEHQYRADLVLDAKVNTGTATPPPDAIAEFTWDDKDHHWPIVPDILQDEEGRAAGVFNEETDSVNMVKRASYVTIYPTLCPAAVYCEWSTSPSALSPFSSRTGRAVEGEHLATAVLHARKSHPNALPLRVEDLKLRLWNSYALYGGVAQWGVLATAALVGVCRYFHIPTHLLRALGSVIHGIEALSRGAVELGTNRDALAVRFENLWTSAMSVGDTVGAVPLRAAGLLDPIARFLDVAALPPARLDADGVDALTAAVASGSNAAVGYVESLEAEAEADRVATSVIEVVETEAPGPAVSAAAAAAAADESGSVFGRWTEGYSRRNLVVVLRRILDYAL